MPQRLIGVTSVYPGLLASLAKSKQEPPYAIIEREGRYYLSFFDSVDPMNTEKAEQSSDVLLSNINAILTLSPFKVSNALKKTNHIITIDDDGREIGKRNNNIKTRFGLSPDFTNMDFTSFIEMEIKASKLSRIKQALRYYADGFNWFNFYDVYECIRKDCQEMMGQAIPVQWTTDEKLRNRLDDFTESANNAYISGYAARHTYAESYEIERISARIKASGKEIMPMTLHEAGEFIENLLSHWLKQRGIHF